MEVNSEPLHSQKVSHDILIEDKFKFEALNPQLNFSVDHFLNLPDEIKMSRLRFTCGNEGIEYFVHRGIWPLAVRRKIKAVTLSSEAGIHAVMGYCVAPLYSKALRLKLGIEGNEKIIHLRYLGVDSEYQRQEIGLMLLHMLIDLGQELAVKDSSYKYIVLEAPTKNACDFYESQGFKKIGLKLNGEVEYAYPL